MELTLKSARRYVDEIPAPLAVVGVWGGELGEEGNRLDAKYQKTLSKVMGELHFKGDFGETLLINLAQTKGEGPGFVLLFGLGKKRGVSLETVRRAGARLVQEIARLGFKEAVTEVFSQKSSAKKKPAMPWLKVRSWVDTPGTSTKPAAHPVSGVKNCAYGWLEPPGRRSTGLGS